MEIKGEEYNKIIFAIFFVGMAFSLLILYIFWNNTPSKEIIRNAMLYFGIVSLVYSSLLIEKFVRKKKSLNNNSKNELESSCISTEFIAEFFLILPLFFIYILTIIYESQWIFGIVTSILTIMVFLNWLKLDFFEKIDKNIKDLTLIVLLAILGITFFVSSLINYIFLM